MIIPLALAVLTACSSSAARHPSSGPGRSDSSPAPISSGEPVRTVGDAAHKGPCSLASADDVRAAFGGTSSAGKPNTDTPGRRECQWSVSRSGLGGGGVVYIYYDTVQTRPAFDTAKAGLAGTVDITGVGDAAYYFPAATSLTFAHGDTVLSVQYLATESHPDAAALQHDEATLAATVSGRL